jgi:nicotinamide-nucleotide amidase
MTDHDRDRVALATELLRRLRERGWSVAVAESLTGGLLASAIVDVPGASQQLRGGAVCYDTRAKRSVLGVDEGLLAAHGAVHPEVAVQMASGVRELFAFDDGPADVGISTTGIAGPESPDGQPVGTVHVGVSTPEGTWQRELLLDGGRVEIRLLAVAAALDAAIERL